AGPLGDCPETSDDPGPGRVWQLPFRGANGGLDPVDGQFPLRYRRSCVTGEEEGLRHQSSPIFSALMKASWGISTLPNWRIFFLPAFCFSSSLRLRVASPP